MSSCWCILHWLCPYCHSRENTTPGSSRGVSKQQPTGLIQPAACFRVAQKLRRLFIFLNGWKRIKRIIFRDLWKWWEIQVSVSIWKALLACRHAHSFMDCLQLLRHTAAEVRSCDRDGMAATEPKIFAIWSFSDKVCRPLLYAQHSTR